MHNFFIYVNFIFCLPIIPFFVHISIMEWKILRFSHMLVLLMTVILYPLASTESYAASKNITLSIVFAPGGALDTAARVLAQEAEKELGQNIIAQNNPSGGGVMGVAKLAKAKADGSQLAACVSNALIYLPHRSKVPYDPLKDLKPLLIFGQASPVLVTSPDAPWKDFAGFLAASRNGHQPVRIAVPGIGTPSHIALAMIAKNDPTLTWRFIPFNGPGEAEAALLGGHVDAAASGALLRIKNGQLSPLMVLAGTSLPALPSVPSLVDAGFSDPGRGDSAFLLLAPAGLPEEETLRLEAAFENAAHSEAFRRALEKTSVAPMLLNREQSRRFLEEAWRNEGPILEAAGVL